MESRTSFFVGKKILFSLVSIALFIAPLGVSAITAINVFLPYLYNFNSDGTLQEAGSELLSTSGYWWVNSGAKMIMKDGLGSTNIGNLSTLDSWKNIYALNNPVDTDNGFHPQNIFRLIGRAPWTDAITESYFNITANNLSNSPNRNASNGILLFSRYQNSDNLYYSGLRVDGSAIIKKKLAGKYYTLAEIKNVNPGVYDTTNNPNLIPLNTWIGIQTHVKNELGGKVHITMYIDIGKTNNWKKVADVIDDGVKNGVAITGAGVSGIRTDFMDVQFDNFRVKSI